MGMPQPDGLETVRRIRNSPQNVEATIIMLSSTDDIPMLRNAFREGANFVFQKPVTSARILPFLAALASPGWKTKVRAARLPLFTQVTCQRRDEEVVLRSMNISESGMLLQTAVDFEEGEAVSLEFDIAEVQARVKVKARIVRKDGRGQAGVEFIDLAPEHQNAIQLYVMGRLTPRTSKEREGTRSIWLGHGIRP
jgi:CheY-like chemotaxis protein